MYNGSKAALATASETWRRELHPLGVRTITLITLAVKTNFFAEDHRAKIPETSHYFAIRDFIHGLTDGRFQANGISPRECATKVVREVEKGTVGTVWVGADAFVARLAWWLSPQFVRVSFGSSTVEGGYLIGITGQNVGKFHSYLQRDGQGLAKEQIIRASKLSQLQLYSAFASRSRARF